MFDIKKLQASFDASIKKLEGAEAIVRETLRELSRDVLHAWHEHENIVYFNKLVQAKMTPVNRKAMLLFLQEFTGFQYSAEKKEFTKKDKALFEEKKAKAIEFLEDPLNNFWTWAEREIDIEVKDWTPEKVTKMIQSSLKKAVKNGFTQADVIKAVLAGGLDIAALADILQGMEIPKHEEQEEPAKEEA